jgi:hypothetical protein
MMDFVVRETRAVVDGPMAIIRLGTCGLLDALTPVGTLVVASQGSVLPPLLTPPPPPLCPPRCESCESGTIRVWHGATEKMALVTRDNAQGATVVFEAFRAWRNGGVSSSPPTRCLCGGSRTPSRRRRSSAPTPAHPHTASAAPCVRPRCCRAGCCAASRRRRRPRTRPWRRASTRARTPSTRRRSARPSLAVAWHTVADRHVEGLAHGASENTALQLVSGGCSGQRACKHALLGAPRLARLLHSHLCIDSHSHHSHSLSQARVGNDFDDRNDHLLTALKAQYPQV